MKEFNKKSRMKLNKTGDILYTFLQALYCFTTSADISMGKSPWEGNSRSASQKVSAFYGSEICEIWGFH